ncbi:MAG: hypothetical protein CVV64_14755 [Candidatus Wallbacteria bacterium HGW-Wallbacteria-1]|jgi:O-antigen/teichoic acid export membrane protein|uniref:Polysaccharide biosynthesis protein C-terminal domain-containing protein n=1 Tax=Candidatus Wallbacteria bacterium HGW-Wallbacteria-1 TaxID=2013854 RepID=A0A2N1PLV5_9BACT|nr:MAG: hypothetical protein CVV64_14755 [Candidatus Wallbacteria bacterium HGW-Wallbacteria-1]
MQEKISSPDNKSIFPYISLPLTAGIGRAAQMILSVILRRFLDPLGLANLTIGQTLYSYLDLTHFGIRSSLAREIPALPPDKRSSLAASAALGIFFTTSAASVVATVIILFFLRADPLLMTLCASWVALFLPFSVVAFSRAMLRSLGDTRALASLNLWQGLSITIFSLALIPIAGIWGYIAGTLLGNLVLIPFLLPRIPAQLGIPGKFRESIPAWARQLPPPQRVLNDLRHLTSVGLPILFIEMASVFSLTADRWIILAIHGSRGLGIWAGGAIFLSLATIIPSAFSEIMLPRIVEKLRTADLGQVKKEWIKASAWQFLSGFIMAAIAIPLIPKFINLLFPAYIPAAPSAQLLVAQTPLLCLNSAASCLLIALGRFHSPAIINFLFPLFAAAGCFMFRNQGLTGAALAMLAARTLVSILFTFMALRASETSENSTGDPEP